MAVTGAAGAGFRREAAPPLPTIHQTEGVMQIGGVQRGNTETFLVHIFGRGLEDNRYVVERFRSAADGAITPVPTPAPATRGKKRRRPRHTVTSLSNVTKMRPARDEIIVCTAVNLEDSGVQLWGEFSCGFLAQGRHR